ncbi:MAG: type II toxin-antitoxin system Phd/YefM family antitoxin [Magnetococcales bacterium]|nr:type II toxin-antitoxin system Phd/YefM family antitoxin [Magnetococcales bacterium]MBF0437483.1 type II toxin-antitoxin system Phd/YefM family antitoxin [Magnetococcales bacterium]
MSTWQLQEATARFSELVHLAKVEGPQEIMLHGEPTVVLLSHAEFNRITCPDSSFVAFMRASPLVGEEIDLERDRSCDHRQVAL